MSIAASISKITEAKMVQGNDAKIIWMGSITCNYRSIVQDSKLAICWAVLTIGLTTEAVIFFFSAFEKQYEDYDWSLVYPELAHMEDPSAKKPAQQLDEALQRAKIDNELIESLNEGLRSFGDATTKLNETIAAAASINDYNDQIQEGVKNMNALNFLYELQLQASNQQMEATNQFLNNLQSSVEDSKRFQEQVNSLAENLESLNKVYAKMLDAMNPNK